MARIAINSINLSNSELELSRYYGKSITVTCLVYLFNPTPTQEKAVTIQLNRRSIGRAICLIQVNTMS